MKAFPGFVLIGAIVLLFSGCASIPLDNSDNTQRAKAFSAPAEGQAGVYIYRNSFVGKALKKDLWIDGKCIGKSSNKVFFYTQVEGGREHTVATQSEFSPKILPVFMEAGRNYFIRQYIQFGAFIGGTKIELVDEARGRSEIEKLSLAVNGTCSREFPN